LEGSAGIAEWLSRRCCVQRLLHRAAEER